LDASKASIASKMPAFRQFKNIYLSTILDSYIWTSRRRLSEN